MMKPLFLFHSTQNVDRYIWPTDIGMVWQTTKKKLNRRLLRGQKADMVIHICRYFSYVPILEYTQTSTHATPEVNTITLRDAACRAKRGESGAKRSEKQRLDRSSSGTKHCTHTLVTIVSMGGHEAEPQTQRSSEKNGTERRRSLEPERLGSCHFSYSSCGGQAQRQTVFETVH